MFTDKDADALAAWSLIIPDNDNAATDSSTELEDNGDKLEGPLFGVYEPSCGTTWTYADDFYMCKLCEHVQFDKQCLDKLRDGSLKQGVCSPEHEMLHIPAHDPAERRRIGEGNVKVGEQVVVEITFLSYLKQDAQADGVRYTFPNILAPRYGSLNDNPAFWSRFGNQAQNQSISITVDVLIEKP